MEKEFLSAEIQMKVRRKAFLSCICKLEFTLVRTEQTGIFMLSHHKPRSPLTQLSLEFSHQKGEETLGFCSWMLSELLGKRIFKTRVFAESCSAQTSHAREGQREAGKSREYWSPVLLFPFLVYFRVLKSPVVALKNFTLQQ